MDPSSGASTRAARSTAVGDLLAALDGLRQRYRGDDAEADRHRGVDAERITGEVARQLAIARVRLAATALPPDRDRSFSSPPDTPQQRL